MVRILSGVTRVEVTTEITAAINVEAIIRAAADAAEAAARAVLAGLVLHRPVYTDETAARTWATNYQNTTGRPIMVFFYAQCIRAAINDGAYIDGLIGAGTPPTSVVASSGFLVVGQIDQSRFALVFMVPENYYYRINRNLVATGNAVKIAWWEATV